MRFRPCTSVTEYIIMMSEGPTYCPTLPEATVEIITLGRPTGRRRIAGVTSAVPPEPAAEMMPPIPCWRTIQASTADAMARTAEIGRAAWRERVCQYG